MKTQSSFFTKLINFGVVLLAFVTPLFFLPFTIDPHNFNKQVLLMLITFFLLLLWVAKSLQQKGFACQKNPLSLPIAALAAVFLLSSLLQSPNRIAAFSGRGGLILVLTILYFLMINNLSRKAASLVLTSLIASSVVAVWLAIFSYLELTSKFLPFAFAQNKLWNPTGSPFVLLTFLIILLPATLYLAFSQKDFSNKVLSFVAAIIQVMGIVLTVSSFVTGKVDFLYLYPHIGWSIAVDGFKTLRTALLGFGPENFISAFSKFKPIIFNQTKFWTVRFTANSNEYFNVLSIAGLLGLACYLLLVIKFWKTKKEVSKTKISRAVFLSLATSFLLQLGLTANFLVLMTTFVLLAVLSILGQTDEAAVYYSIKDKKSIFLSVISLGLVLSLAGGYLVGRVWAADYYFTQSLKAAAENKGGLTYNLQIEAIQLNPFVENYRLVYSDTCLALANSLASKTELTDQDRVNIQQLVAQSIREAKAAVSLNQQNSANWEHLAAIYRNLINFAQGADQWAITAYAQAVRNNPTDPLLRVDLGGLFYALQDYDQAILQFVQATALKPDYANGYYNLASAYREKGEYQKAFENMQIVLSLVDKDSPDYQKVNSELEDLGAKLPPQPAAEAEEKVEKEAELSEPKPLPSPKPGFGQITFPEEEEKEVAPEVPVEPSPSPSVSPSPTASGSFTPTQED